MTGRIVVGWLALSFLVAGMAQAGSHSDHGRMESGSSAFRDVPRGHWAYEAVRQAAEAGVLQGFEGKFHGNKTISRYQMALIVSRLLEHLSGSKDGAQNLTEQDLQNLEALTIEFADELALLNVKVSTLEDSFAELRYDVEALKSGGPVGHGAPHPARSSSGIHGLAALRLVATAANGPTGAVGNIAGNFVPLARYSGDVGVDATGAGVFTSKVFFTIPQLSVSWTRDIDEGIGAHLQLDIDADIAENLNNTAGAGPTLVNLPAGDTMIQVNEGYIDVVDFFYGIGARMGAFALPISREHNGSHRSLDYTITPAAINSRLESYRPVGIEFRNEDDFIRWDWRLGILSGLDGPLGLVDSILMPALTISTLNAAAVPGAPNLPLTDVSFGVQSQAVGTESSALGFYARVGDQPNQGFGWDINFIANGGNISPDAGAPGTAAEFTAIAGSLTYYWKFFDIIVQGYQGTSSNTATAGPVPNAAADAVTSTGLFGLFNYRFDPDNSVTLRVESSVDDVASIGTVTMTAVTAAYNRVISDHSLFQLEVVVPTAEVEAVAGNGNGAATNATDQDDTLIQANYKLRF